MAAKTTSMATTATDIISPATARARGRLPSPMHENIRPSTHIIQPKIGMNPMKRLNSENMKPNMPIVLVELLGGGGI